MRHRTRIITKTIQADVSLWYFFIGDVEGFRNQKLIRTFATAILAAAALGKNEKIVASCHFFILYAS